MMVAYRMSITKVFWRNLSFENNVLGALTSITAPCLLLKENSNYFWMTNYIDQLLSMLVVWATYFIARYDLSQFTSHLTKNTIFQCEPLTRDWNVHQISRCSNISGTEACYSGLFPISGSYTFTACPPGSNQWLPLLNLSFVLTFLQVASKFSVLIMNYLSDELNRFNLSIFLNKCSKFPILWKERNKDWQDDAKEYLEGKLDNDQDRLISLLKSAIHSGGFLGLIQVNSMKM